MRVKGFPGLCTNSSVYLPWNVCLHYGLLLHYRKSSVTPDVSIVIARGRIVQSRQWQDVATHFLGAIAGHQAVCTVWRLLEPHVRLAHRPEQSSSNEASILDERIETMQEGSHALLVANLQARRLAEWGHWRFVVHRQLTGSWPLWLTDRPWTVQYTQLFGTAPTIGVVTSSEAWFSYCASKTFSMRLDWPESVIFHPRIVHCSSQDDGSLKTGRSLDNPWIYTRVIHDHSWLRFNGSFGE